MHGLSPTRPPRNRSPRRGVPLRRAGLLAGLLLVGGPVVLPHTAPRAAAARWDAAENYRFATGLYDKRRFQQAERALRQYVAANPGAANTGRAKMYLGFTLGQLGKYAEARNLLRDFVKNADPGDKYLRDATLRLGIYAGKAGVPREADRVLSDFVAAKPGDDLNEYALGPLGEARAALGDRAGAERAYRQLAADFPQSGFLPRARLKLAGLLAEGGQVDEAAAELRDLAAGAGADAAVAEQARFDLGFLLYQVGRDEEALRAFSDLIERHPKGRLTPEGRLFAGFAFFRLGDFSRAAKLLREAAEDPRLTARARYWSGTALRRMGQPAEAAADLTAAVAADPDGTFAPRALNELAEVQAGEGRTAEARRTLDRFLSRYGTSESAPDATLRAAKLALADRDADAAGRLLDRFEAQFADTPAAERAAARLAGDRGALANLRWSLAPEADAAARTAALRDAVEWYGRARELTADPAERGRAAALLGQAHYRLGEYRQSLDAVAPSLEALTPAAGEPAPPVLADVLQVAMLAADELEDFARVGELAGLFLDRFPRSPWTENVFSLAANAEARAGDLQAAGELRETFKLSFPASAALTPLTLDLADRAFEAQEFERAAGLFGEAVSATAIEPGAAVDEDRRRMRGEALAGAGWSEYRRGRFDAAADLFGRLVSELPGDPRADEAMVMRGVSLREAGDVRAAETALRSAWSTLAPAAPAPAGAEQTAGRPRQAWLAGLTLARLLTENGRVDAADAAFADLLGKFPEARQLGPLLWEWGRMLHVAQRFADADAKFARLLEVDPGHEEADRAVLLLAESDWAGQKLDAADAKFARLTDAPAEGEAPGNTLAVDPATREAAFRQRLDLAAARGNVADQERIAGRFLQAFPAGEDAPRVRFLRAQALRRRGGADALREARAELTALRALRNDAAVGGEAWYPDVWILEADAAFALKDYDAVEQLAAELDTFEPTPPDLFKMRELQARVAKQRPPVDLPRAERLANAVLDDPRAKGTIEADRARLLLGDIAHLRTPPDYAAARDHYLRLNLTGSTPAMRAAGGLGAARMDEQLGEVEEAKRTYREVAAEYPGTDAAESAAARLAELG